MTKTNKAPEDDQAQEVVTEKELGKRIRRLRNERGLTQERLAEAANLSVDTVRRLERGRFSPSFATLRKISRGLGVSVIGLISTEHGKSDGFAEMIRRLPEPHKDVAYAVLGTLHVHAASS